MLLLFTFSILVSSCSFRKVVKKPDALLNKYEIRGLEGRMLEEADVYIKQKPNRKLLGIGLLRIYVGIYAMFDTKKHHKWQERIKSGIGEAPVVYDSTLTRFSALQIQNYLFSKGYFNAQVKDSVHSKRRKAKVVYLIDKKQAYTIRNTTYDIADSSVEAIYRSELINSTLNVGENYDEEKQAEERNRTNALLKNNGYYFFNREYIYFDVDTALDGTLVDIYTRIEEPLNGNHHKAYHIGNVFITVQPTGLIPAETQNNDTTILNEYHFFDPERKIKPKALTKTLLLKKGDLFRQQNLDATYARLADLGVFRFIDIHFEVSKTDTTILDCHINLSSNKKQEIRTELEGFLNSENVGTAGNLTLRNNNLFRGAEFLEFRVKGGIETQAFLNNKDNIPLFNSRLFNSSVNLSFPKFLFLPKLNTSGRYGSPRSRIAINYTFEQRPDYNRRTLNSSLTYEWKETKFKSHLITPLDINFINASLSNDARNRIILSNNKYLLESFNPHISAGGKYSYIYNSQELNKTKDFSYLRFNVEIAGNSFYLLGRFTDLPKDTGGSYKLFGLTFYNYIRPEIDFRRYKLINANNTIVFRIYTGAGIAYLNSTILPFEKQFFIGGSNSLRAWKARTIGPGTYSTINREEQTTILKIDQTGDVKLEGNIEYRFDLFDRFLGSTLRTAAFLDYGNIWELADKNTAPNTVLDWRDFYTEIAIGTGVGLRFDYSFFIFRIDAGLKLRDPQFEEKDRWVIRHFSDEQWKKDNGDYSFINFNFGIGYPF